MFLSLFATTAITQMCSCCFISRRTGLALCFCVCIRFNANAFTQHDYDCLFQRCLPWHLKRCLKNNSNVHTRYPHCKCIRLLFNINTRTGETLHSEFSNYNAANVLFPSHVGLLSSFPLRCTFCLDTQITNPILNLTVQKALIIAPIAALQLWFNLHFH